MSGKTEEKDINLLIAQKVQAYLELGGAYVLMTREEDEALGSTKSADMNKRRQITNMRADILISVHQNSFSSTSVRGAQAFYYKNSPKSRLLADCIQKYLKSDLSSKNNMESKGNSSYYVLKHTSIPSVIVECGFLSNYTDRQNLNSDLYQEKVAWAIYKGIVDYFQREAALPGDAGKAAR